MVSSQEAIDAFLEGARCEMCNGTGRLVWCEACRCGACNGVGDPPSERFPNQGTRNRDCQACGGEPDQQCIVCTGHGCVSAAIDHAGAHVCDNCEGWGIGEQGILTVGLDGGVSVFEPPPAEPAEFYVLSIYHSGGDVLLWWRPKNAGYTTALEFAGRYSQADLDAHPGYYDSDRNKPIPCAIVDALAHRVVDSHHLTALKGDK